jgi:hypothetical protein
MSNQTESQLSSMNVTILSISEFEEAIADLRQRNPDRLLLFRGQTTDRPLATSIKRHNADKDFSLIPDIHYSWCEFATYVLHFLGHITHRRSETVMAVLQHYGARSHFLDVTHDPLVALWFSLNRFNKKGTIFIDEDEEPHIIFHPAIAANYVASANLNGFVYILGVSPSIQQTSFVDLAKSMPEAFLRVHRQRAALLSNRDVQFDWNAHIVARFRIAGPLTNYVFPHELSFRWFFPGPDEDILYRELVRVPYYAPFGHSDKPVVVHPLLLIPYYLGDLDENKSSLKDTALHYDEIIKHLHATPAEYFFPYNCDILTNKHEHVSVQHAISEAMPVLVPRVKDWRPVDDEYFGEGILDESAVSWCPGPDILSKQWSISRGNIFIEFSLGAYLLRPSGNECLLLRGLWVIIEQDLIYVAAAWEGVERRQSRIAIGPGVHFKFNNGAYEIDPQPEDCSCPHTDFHLWSLMVFLRATYWWVEGTCDLAYDDKRRIFHLVRSREQELVDFSFA